jgi:hypothetical protein
MKKRINIIFFSICFLGAIIAEAYFILAEAGNLISVIGIGMVALIMCYLLMDSIRSKLSESSKSVKNYIDQMYREDTERWNERFMELQNLQKATYTAIKKNTSMTSEQYGELLIRVETLEANNSKAVQKIIELQKKALEGQKNSLSLEINHNKENTKQIVKALRETSNQEESKELLNRILERLEKGTEVIKNELQSISITIQGPLTNNLYSEHNWDINSGSKVENLTDTGWNVDAEVELVDADYNWKGETGTEEEKLSIEWDTDAIQTEDLPTVEGWGTEMEEEKPTVSEAWGAEPSVDNSSWNMEVDMELNKLIEGWGNATVEEKTPEIIDSYEKEPISEVVEAVNEVVEEAQPLIPEVKPLYADPNKALSADEIAALFASIGQ